MLRDPIKKSIPVKFHPYWALLKVALISYFAICFFSWLTLEYLVDKDSILSSPMEGQSAVIFAIAFFLFATPLIYFANCLLARSWIKLNLKSIVLHMGVVMFLASFLEILVDTLFVEAIGRPSWEYRIWPRYNAFTSGVVFIMWPMYGFHQYCFKEAMKKIKSPLIANFPARAIMVAIDAMIMETVANMFAIIAFSSYYFYYLRGDLFHFTTIEIFVPYIFVGFITLAVLDYLEKSRFNYVFIGVLGLIIGWTFLGML